MDSESDNTSGLDVLLGLAGHTICQNLGNDSLRSLSECSKQLNSLSFGSIRALAPRKLPTVSLQERFAHLKVLDLSRDQCRLNFAASLREVPSLKHLGHLRLQRCLSLTDEVLAELASSSGDNTSLTSIDFRGCTKLTWTGLGHLSQFKNLRHLNCSGIKYVEDGVTDADKAEDTPLHCLLGQLSHLTMGDACTLSWVDDRLMAVVGKHASSLVMLDCSGCIDMSDAGVLAVCKLRHLEEISLQSCVRLTNKCFESLQHMTDLQSLNLRGCLQITSEGLLMISRLTKLENLDLTCCPAIQSLDAGLLSHLARLKSLNVSSCSSLTSLDHLPLLSKTLENLSIASCSKLGVDSLTTLSSMTGLVNLDMSGLRNRGPIAEDVEDRLSRLSRLTNLETLHLSRFTHPQGLPRGLLMGLSGMVSLRELHMANCSRERMSSSQEGKNLSAISSGSNPVRTATNGSESQLWFLESLVQLQHLDLSGWRHARASSLVSLAGLTQLTQLKIHRYGNDTGSSRSAGGGNAVEVDRVHEMLRPVRCPRPLSASESSEDSDGSGSESTIRAHYQGDDTLPEAPWLLDPAHSIEVDYLQERIARFGLGSGSGSSGDGNDSSESAAASSGGDMCGGAHSQSHCCDLYPNCFCLPNAVRGQSLSENQQQAPPFHNGRENGSVSDFVSVPEHGLDSLVPLSGLTKLAILDMEACVTLTDGGVRHLSGLSRLERLNLSGCVKLSGWTLDRLPLGLEELCLDDCPRIGGAAFANVAALTSLRSLSLRGCSQIDDGGLHAISSGLGRLNTLSLFSAAGVSARGLRSLSRLPHLKALHLSHCWNVDDEGLTQLARAKSLVKLNLQHCWKVSEAALMTMQQANPVLEILMG